MSSGSAAPGAGAGPSPDRPWAQAAKDVVAALGTSAERGLSTAEAVRRLHQVGPNRLRRMRRRSDWQILRDQFSSLIVVLLVFAGAAAFAFDELLDGIAISLVIAINAGIGFVTERRAMRSMEALRELGHTETHVCRDGSVRAVAAGDLVPGDVVVLDAGDVLSADIRLISASRLQADESPLTGESMPVDKGVDAVAPDAPLSERRSMLFKGTALTRGSGRGVVVSTGMATELGRISSLVEEAEPETTPLEKRLDRLARRLVGLTLAIAVAVAAAVIGSGRDLYFAVEIAIALAVATIPEGLPIVATVALARGMWRMARRNALVEQLAAVETLGSTTVILTDKTGTLTENRMTVVELRVGEERIEVGGVGLEIEGPFQRDATPLDPATHSALIEALRTGVLCNNATLQAGGAGEAVATGDPTEVALLVAGAKAGVDRGALIAERPEVLELAFDPDTQRMATVHAGPDGFQAAVKGAPERVLDCCTAVRGEAGTEPLDADGRRRWAERAEAMAATGKRVLALATARVPDPESFDFEELELLALVGFLDPPRERVRKAIDACQDAGIRVVMVTGDHGATAWTVAAAVGLIDPQPGEPPTFVDARALPELAALSDAEATTLLEAPVIARATPRQKLDLMGLYQRRGAIVAMTGDGVNDAPALKKADIGVAMGLRGTQVAREAADMVLRDDELTSIVAAVAQGRAIYANIRKFVIYLMSCNVSEILVVGLGAVAPGPFPLLPLQILFLNLVTDVFPALALGVGEGSPALMRDPPRDPREPLLARGHWRRIFGLGGVIAVCVLAALGLAVAWLGKSPGEATTVAFLTLAMAQLWHVFTMRNVASGWVRNEITANPWVWGALLLCLVLIAAAVHWPPLAEVLSVTSPGASGWALALALSLASLVAGQLSLVRRRGGRRAS